MLAEVAETAVDGQLLADSLRILVVSGLAALGGALFVRYVVGTKVRRARGEQAAPRSMIFGGTCAILLILIVALDQFGRVGNPVTWRLPVALVAVAAGMTSIATAPRHKRRHPPAKPQGG